MAREEEEKTGLAGRIVNPQFLGRTRNVKIANMVGIDYENSYHFGQIGAAITGLPTGSFTDVYVSYLPAVGGSYIRATAIPVGAQCRFYCSVSCNSGGGFAWAVAITVVDLTDGVLKDYHIASTSTNVNIAFADGIVNNLTNTPWVMPPHDLNLSWRLFASFDATPDQSKLQSGDPSMYY